MLGEERLSIIDDGSHFYQDVRSQAPNQMLLVVLVHVLEEVNCIRNALMIICKEKERKGSQKTGMAKTGQAYVSFE